jgi:hypothetical protein
MVLEQRFAHHSGPLPDPETLRSYGDIVEDFPERIMRRLRSSKTRRSTQR